MDTRVRSTHSALTLVKYHFIVVCNLCHNRDYRDHNSRLFPGETAIEMATVTAFCQTRKVSFVFAELIVFPFCTHARFHAYTLTPFSL